MLNSGSKYLSIIDEPARVKVVKQYDLINFKYNQQLHHIVTTATKFFKTPIAFIAFMDSKMLWVKVSKGLDIEQVPRSSSFSQHTIKLKRTFVISDALSDPRFALNPYVTKEPKIRFYAGAPLINQAGICIGTLCVMDKKSRDFTGEQKSILEALAQSVSNLMELKLTTGQLNGSLANLKVVQKSKSQNELRLRAMFESLSDAYFLLDLNGEIIDFNHIAYQLIQDNYRTKLSLGRTMSGFIKPEYRELFLRHLQNALNLKPLQVKELEGFIIGDKIWWVCRFNSVIDDCGEIIGVSYIVRNINEKKWNESEIQKQKQSLMKIAEIQSHDYRGPVATILGMMNLIENDDYVASREYLLMLHTAARKLDEKIRDVVNTVHESRL